MGLNIPRNIIVHHSLVASKGDQLKGINSYHQKQGFPKSSLGYYVGYQYLINSAGVVTQTREDTESGAHCSQKFMNYRSIGICLEGHFDLEEPTIEQVKSLRKLIKDLQHRFTIPDGHIYPHRHFATYKSCWGSRLPNDILGYLDLRLEKTKPRPVSPWAEPSVEKAKKKGIEQWENPQQIADAVITGWTLHKLGLLSKVPQDGITKEQLIVALDRAGLFDK